ncbi:TRAP transporter large permease subunit [Brevibacterium album]|uniref:TRAP transporter large permease subunit n=1 Tax=Brevibacterium album TaxID=417948 RepID=UPI00048C80F7|nr:TRAP transporter large permease subunit [Brevibacterium album]
MEQLAVIVVPMVLLFGVILVKRIPLIGGSVEAALLICGLSIAVLAGVGPLEALLGAVDGIDRMAWVIALSLLGAIYAETQVRMGTIDSTMALLRRVFGDSPRGLIAATFVTLVIGGSLLGDAIATATVIGFLVIHSLAAMGVRPVQIGMIILVGASLGSIMPPVSQAILLSSSLVGTDPGPVIRIAFLTVGAALVFAILESFRFVRKGKAAEAAGAASGTGPGLRAGAGASGAVSDADAAGTGEGAALAAAPPRVRTLLRTKGHTFVPMLVLLAIVLLNTGWGINVFTAVPGLSHLTAALESVPILSGFANPVVMAIGVAALLSFLYPEVRRAPVATLADGLKKVTVTVRLQLCAGFLVGMVYASGLVDTVAELAQSMQGGSVTAVGVGAILVLGMLTGSQTAAQTVVVPFLSPILEQTGVDPFNIALSMSHIAAAAQNLPPVGLTAFVVVGLVGGSLSTKVDPVKVMVLALPNSLFLIAVGVVALLV